MIAVTMFVVIFAALLFFVHVSIHQERSRSWQRMARRLKLTLKANHVSGQARITGAFEGLRVEIVKKSSQEGPLKSSTRYRLSFPDLNLGMKIRRRGDFSPLLLFSTQPAAGEGVPLGKGIVVECRRQDEMKRFLTPVRRVRLRRVFVACPECRLTDKGIELETRGMEKSALRMEAIVRLLARLGNAFGGHSQLSGILQQVLQKQRDGYLAEAFELIERVPEGTGDPDVPAMTAELLCVAGRFGQALQALARIGRLIPPDPELRRLSQFAEQQLQRMRREESEGQSAPDEPAITDLRSLASELFSQGLPGYAALDLFEDRYRNRSVRWSSKLLRAEKYAKDLVFGLRPGVRAVFELPRQSDSLYGFESAQVIVCGSNYLADDIVVHLGVRFEFSGRLAACDPFSRNLYVDDAELALPIPEPEEADPPQEPPPAKKKGSARKKS